MTPLIPESELTNNGLAIRVKIDGFGIKSAGAWELYPGRDPFSPIPIVKIEHTGKGKSVILTFRDGFVRAMDAAIFFPPTQPEILVRNIGELLTFSENTGVGLKKGWAFTVGAGKILAMGPEEEVLSTIVGTDIKVIDATGNTVSPGLVDPHTHPVFAKNRAHEFEMRIDGADYNDILASGGGILNSAKNTRKADLKELVEGTIKRIKRSVAFGVTSMEGKSGYALNLEGELKSLEVLKIVSTITPMDIAPSLLAAHVVPGEYKDNRNEYVDLIVNEILPAVKRKDLAFACDVFCEKSAFSLAETEKILKKAQSLGIKSRIHAGQFNSLGAVKLGAEIGALSVDHLEAVSEDEMAALEASSTVATLLPGAALTLNMKPPSARRFLDRNIPVALATDMNPGTSMTENLPLMASLGTMQMGMTVDEAWRAITINAAKAAGFSNAGKLAPGGPADFVIWDFNEYSNLPYHFGTNLVQKVFKKGIMIREN